MSEGSIVISASDWRRMRDICTIQYQEKEKEVCRMVRGVVFHPIKVDLAELGKGEITWVKKDFHQDLYSKYLTAVAGNDYEVPASTSLELCALSLGELDVRMQRKELRSKKQLLEKVYELCDEEMGAPESVEFEVESVGTDISEDDQTEKQEWLGNKYPRG